jgi:hypothetical protein
VRRACGAARRRSGGLVAVTLAVAACAAGSPDVRPFDEALRRYNAAVSEAHRTGSTTQLEGAASEAEVQRVRVLVGGLRSQGEVLVARLDALFVSEVKVDPEDANHATVIARERWTYERRSTRTRGPSTPSTSREYEMRYQLSRRGTDWLVERVEYAKPSNGAHG